jgi:alpha-galactosidase
LAKSLSDGSIALGFFNIGDRDGKVSLTFWDLGLSAVNGYSLEFYDCMNHMPVGIFKEIYTTDIEAHGCRVYRAKLITDC